MALESKKYIDNPDLVHHEIKVGINPDVIDEIGSDIDFLILDTLHIVPGEMLDFLVCLPYLTKDAIVVLHDAIN